MESTIHRSQGTKQVWRAEFRRALRQGGWLKVTAWTVTLSLAVGCGTLAMVNLIADAAGDAPSAVMTFPVEITSVVAAFVLALGLSMSTARDSQGMLSIAMTNVPKRRRLLLAQMGCAFAYSSVVVGGVALTMMVAAAFIEPSGAGIRFAALGVLCGSLSGGMLACIAYQLGRLVTQPAVAVLVVLGWWLILPLALVAVGFFLPSPVQVLISKIVEGAPSALLVNSATVSTLGTNGPGALIGGLAGLAAWTVLLGWLVLVTSPKREYK